MQAVSLAHRAGIMVPSGVSLERSPKQAVKATEAYGVQASRKIAVRVRPTLATRISLRVADASPLRSDATFIFSAFGSSRLADEEETLLDICIYGHLPVFSDLFRGS